ncbi:unnamed protein product [Clonostachys chloroleuca]|uniref:Zn(2)-C6 fungal-type domain-containing protein n=1 Tax=Clonostachys chloroleuca TaxID=1926264 RepID=A0AA35M7H8_9HYPO|nr:unnamed protein product [Clonostachys chloroleuca]
MIDAATPETTACWTCYVRHVKCDSDRPACRQCTRRQLQCHGFGPRPAWMDGGSEETKERARIKLAVKRNFSAVRKSQHRAGRKAAHNLVVESLEPGIVRTQAGKRRISPTTGDRGEDDAANITRRRSEQIYSVVDDNTYHTGETPSSSSSQTQTQGANHFDLHEATLMMHYLDQVYPWQFPLYNRVSQLGNRGWLLFLLSKRGPLYHAAMSLAALHKACQNGHIQEFYVNEDAFNHRAKALREMHRFLAIDKADFLLQDKLKLAEILACSVLLISFSKPGTVLGSQLGVPSQPSPSAQPAFITDLSGAGIGFLLVDILWFDLFACISGDRVPGLPYESWLTTPGFNTADVMGCDNCVMQAIGDIAMLRQWKAGQEADGTLSILQLASKARAIEGGIQQDISSTKTGQFTELFASAALIWLYTIVSGPVPSLPEIRNEVAKSMLIIGHIENTCPLRGAVWALSTAGSMAEEHSQPFFTKLFTNLIRESGELGNSVTAFTIVQESWAKQREYAGKGLAIKDCAARALLI